MIVAHSSGKYEVRVSSLEQALQSLPTESRIVTDRNVELVARPWMSGHCSTAVSPGEGSKDVATFSRLLSWLAETGAGRKTSLVALGGGVVGDLTGFVAASYMRGMPFIQIPTTLLAMVDSSVGGKVGIDLPEGKNLAGAFKAPVAVFLPIEMLDRLPKRQFLNGMAEVLKYGYIMDADLAGQLSAEQLTPQSPRLKDVVLRCVQLKADVVEEDEFETTGRRAILNFGHTIGHAIEHAAGYGNILHGEAIAIGMVLEARLGESLGLTLPGTANHLRADFLAYGLPVDLPTDLEPDALITTMTRDKKAERGSLAFSLLTEIGKCKLVRDVSQDAVRSVMVAA